VVERRLDPGTLAAPGLPILRIEGEDEYRLEASFDERFGADVALGDTALALIDTLDLTVPVRIVEILPAVDPSSRTFLVKVALPRSERWKSGTFGRLRLTCGARPGLAVPTAAVRQSASLSSVRVVGGDGRLQMRQVRCGAALPGGLVEIVAGLAPGEKVALQP